MSGCHQTHFSILPCCCYHVAAATLCQSLPVAVFGSSQQLAWSWHWSWVWVLAMALALAK